MRRLLLAFAVAGSFAFMAAPAKADDWSVGFRVGRYYDDHNYHRHGYYWHEGSWYRASPYVTYYDPYYGSYYYDNGFTIRFGTPRVYHSPSYRWHGRHHWR